MRANFSITFACAIGAICLVSGFTNGGLVALIIAGIVGGGIGYAASKQEC